MLQGFMPLIRVMCSGKTAGLAASHIIKNGAVALSPWTVRLLGPIPTILSIVAPPLIKKYVAPPTIKYTTSVIVPTIVKCAASLTKKGSVSRLLWTVVTGKP